MRRNTTATSLSLPKCLDLAKERWNSVPFDENFLALVRARNYYLLDDNGCRAILMNLFEIIEHLGCLKDLEEFLIQLLSQLLVLLALNIRLDEDCAPLVTPASSIDFVFDTLATESYELAITRMQKLPEDIRNAIRSVKNFEFVAPAIAWGIIGELSGSAKLEQAVLSEIERFSKSHGLIIPYPRSYMVMLHAKLDRISPSLSTEEINNCLKRVAIHFKSCTDAEISPRMQMFNRQLQRFTGPYVHHGLGPWSSAFDIANCSYARLDVLLQVLKNLPDVEGDKWERNLDNLRVFNEFYAKPRKFHWQSPFVYSAILSRTFTYLLEDKDDAGLTDSLQEIQKLASSNEPSTNQRVNEVYEDFTKRIETLEIDESFVFEDFWSGDQTIAASKKKRRRKRK